MNLHKKRLIRLVRRRAANLELKTVLGLKFKKYRKYRKTLLYTYKKYTLITRSYKYVAWKTKVAKRPWFNVLTAKKLKRSIITSNLTKFNVPAKLVIHKNIKLRRSMRLKSINRSQFSALSTKQYRCLIRIAFYHNNIRLSLDKRFKFPRHHYSMGLFSEFKRRKKLKRSYVAGLELCLFMFQLLRHTVTRSFIIKLSGGFSARKGFCSGLRKLKTSTLFKKQKPFLVNLQEITVYAHNGTKTVNKRRL